MTEAPSHPTVLQCKCSTYLEWSQPFLHRLISGLDAQVRNVVLCNRTANLDRFPSPRIEIVPVKALVQPRLALREAARLAREHAPDLMHAHFGISALRVLLLKQMLDLPMVTTFGGTDLGVAARRAPHASLYRALFEQGESFVCVSEALKRELAAQGVADDRIEVIRRGTDLAFFRPLERAPRAPDAPLRVLMVGRLAAKKGHRDAFAAVAEVLRRGANPSLRLLGDGEERRSLERLAESLGISERVEFAGIRDAAGVRRALADADVLLQCSVRTHEGDQEGIPNALVEAAATGLTAVATRHGGIGELVEHEKSGLLLEEGDVRGLAEALLALARDPARCSEMGARAAARVRQEFDLATQVERHASLYRRLVASRRAPHAPFHVAVPRGFAGGAVRDDFGLPSLSESWSLLFGPETGLAAEARRGASSGRRGVVAKPRGSGAGWRLAKRVAGVGFTVARGLQSLVMRLDGRARLDALALDYRRAGGDLAGLDPGWRGSRFARELRQRTRSDGVQADDAAR